MSARDRFRLHMMGRTTWPSKVPTDAVKDFLCSFWLELMAWTQMRCKCFANHVCGMNGEKTQMRVKFLLAVQFVWKVTRTSCFKVLVFLKKLYVKIFKTPSLCWKLVYRMVLIRVFQQVLWWEWSSVRVLSTFVEKNLATCCVDDALPCATCCVLQHPINMFHSTIFENGSDIFQ